MTEFFLPFLLGYGIARLLSFMLEANLESTALQEKDIVLKWDNDTFGWRPCTLSSVKDPAARYMVAAPIDYEALSFIKSISSSDE